MVTAPTVVRQAALAIKDIDAELHEHVTTLHGFKYLLSAQNRLTHVLAIQNGSRKCIDHDNFPEDVRAFAHNYHMQKIYHK